MRKPYRVQSSHQKGQKIVNTNYDAVQGRQMTSNDLKNLNCPQMTSLNLTKIQNLASNVNLTRETKLF